MLKRVREVLLTDYIGAIVIAILIADACRTVLFMIVYPAEVLLLAHPRTSAWFGPGTPPAFDWNIYADYILRLVTFAVIVAFMAWWLFGSKAGQPSQEQTPEEASEEETP